MTDCKDEIGWVIESVNNNGHVVYWDGRSFTSFHPNHMEAIRFARKDDAEKLITYCVTHNHPIKSTEHVWINT